MPPHKEFVKTHYWCWEKLFGKQRDSPHFKTLRSCQSFWKYVTADSKCPTKSFVCSVEGSMTWTNLKEAEGAVVLDWTNTMPGGDVKSPEIPHQLNSKRKTRSLLIALLLPSHTCLLTLENLVQNGFEWCKQSGSVCQPGKFPLDFEEGEAVTKQIVPTTKSAEPSKLAWLASIKMVKCSSLNRLPRFFEKVKPLAYLRSEPAW